MANEIPTPAEPVSPVEPSAIPSDLNASPEEILKAARSDSFRASQGMTPWTDGVQRQPAPPSPAAAPAQAAPANGMPTAFQKYTPAQDVKRPSPDPAMDSVDVPSSRSQDPKPPGAVEVPMAKDGYFKVLGYDIAQDAMGFGNAYMRGSATVARSGARIVGFPLAKAADATTSKVMGKTNTGAQDALGDFIHAHIDPAIDEYWKGPDLTGNAVGQVGSGLGEFLPQLVTGGAAAVTSAISAATEKGFKAIDEGHSVKTAAALATIAGIQQYVFMHIPLKDPAIAKRILKAAGLGVGVDVGGKEVEKHLADVLKDPDYQAAVKNIDPLNPTDAGTNALVQTVLAILHGKGALQPGKSVPGATPGKAPPAPNTFAGNGVTAEGNAVTPVDVSKPAPVAPAAAAPAEGIKTAPVAAPAQPGLGRKRIATPGESLAATPPPEVTKPPVQQALPIPDQPSAESSQDIHSQLMDAMDKRTKREGVLVSKGSMQALKNDTTAEGTSVKEVIKKAQGAGRLVKTPNGDWLVMPTTDSALKASRELASGSDPQAVIGRITGAGDGKRADQTAVVQGRTPEGAVASESMVTPAEAPAKVEEMIAEGKTPVVTTPEAAIARRTDTVAEQLKGKKKLTQMTAEELEAEHKAKPAAPVKGIAEVGKKEVPVHLEEGAPEGMQRVRQIGDDGEPSDQTHDIPKERVRTGEATKLAAAAPVKVPTEQAPESKPAVESGYTKTPLEEALANHEAQETPTPGRQRIGKLSDRQSNTADFANVLEAAAKENKGKADDATVQRALKAAAQGKGMGLKSEEATNKGQGTGNARISAINEEMHKAARQLMGKAKPGDEVPAVAPKAAALKARVTKAKVAKETVKVDKAEPKVATAAKRAEAEVRAKFPGVVHLEENVLAKRMLKKRTAEIQADEAKAAVKVKSEMVEAPVFKEVEKTVTDEQLRKARNKAKVDQNQAEMSKHPTHVAIAEKSQAEFDALKRQHDIEHGVALEPDEPKTPAQAAKVEDAVKSHKQLEQEYETASDEDVPEAWDRLVASAEKLLGRPFTEAELADAKAKMDDRRELTKLTQEQEADKTINIDANRAFADTATLLRSRNPLTRMLAQLHKNLQDTGIIRKLEDIRASGLTVGTHEFLRDLIANAPNPMMRGMLQRLLVHVPDLPVRPTGSVHDPRSGDTNQDWGGLFDRTHNFVQYKLHGDRPFTTEAAIHEIVHAATAYELSKNPNGELATELKAVLADATSRFGEVYGHDVVAAHLQFFKDGKVKPKNPIRDLYGLYNIREFVAEAFSNPEFQRMLAQLDNTSARARVPTTFLGRMINAVGKFLGLHHETPLLERVLDLTQLVMEKQSSNPDFRGVYDPPGMDGTIPSEIHAENLPYSSKEKILADAFNATMDERESELMATIGGMVDDPPHLPSGDAELSRIMPEEPMKKIRGFARVIRSGAMAAYRAAKPGVTSADQLMRRNREDFGHADDPKNPLVRLENSVDGRHTIRQQMTDHAAPVAEARLRLPKDVDKKLGQLQIDATQWGIDPSKPKDSQPLSISGQRGFDARYDEFAKRWNNTPDAAKKVFIDERDHTIWASRMEHKAGVDVALSAYDMRDITPAQRTLLYSVKDPSEFDELVGPGKLIDIGESNEPVKRALKSLAGMTRLVGYYAHLGRHGDFVTQVKPEGVKHFGSQAEAEAFADKVKRLSPGSRAKAKQIAGKWQVAYKAEYTSFHKNAEDAESDAQKMRDAGFDVGHVTKKIYGEDNVPMTSGMKELVAEATRQIHKGTGDEKGTQALVENLRGAFLRMMANRSAYAASRLARKSVAGVKAEEMGRNFAHHVQSTAFHTSSLMTIFKEAEALGAVRAAARDQHAPVSQATMYRRGQVVDEIGKRMAQEARQYGTKVWGNAFMAKLGYLNYLMSPAHTAVNLTQNFTTAMPRASVKFGPGKATMAFARAMKLVAGPAFRTTVLAHVRPGTINGRTVLNAVLEAIRKDPVHGKWARGENSPIQQLMDKGIITSTFSNELAAIAKGGGRFAERVFEYARLLPHLSDVFNRTTSAIAHLELSGGNVRDTADFVNETHVNYSAENMPRAFRTIKQIPVVGTSVVMFKTYMQGMAHLMYSMIRDSVMGGRHAEGNFLQKRANAMKTVGALVLGTALFTGLKGATPELVHLAAYAYNKVFGDKNKFWSFEEAMHHALADMLGKTGGELAFAGLPHAAGIDVANRMGFNELMLHNPPDLLTADSDTFNKFVVDQLGTVPGMTLETALRGFKKMSNGDVAGGLSDMVPVKAWQSVVSAMNEYSSGNSHQDGNMMVEPGNKYGAAMQAFGFKPSALANAQEKQGNAIEYRNFVESRKKDIIGEIVAKGYTPETRAKRDAWNKGRHDIRDRVTAADVLKTKHQKHMAEAQVKGRVHERNRDIRKLNDYSGD